MAFDEIRLAADVERGAVGGPGFKTNILELANGFEKRSQVWSLSRGAWDVGYGIRKKVDFATTLSFFYARRGRARGFRFKDWSDYEITDGLIGVGDGATTSFQVIKQYTSSVTYSRDIYKIVSGTASFDVNGVLVDPADYTLDENTGIVVFDTAPPSSQNVTVTCEYDVPVRFNTDRFDLTLEQFDAGAIASLPIVELRIDNT